ncbi:MAG: CDP-diacylglycerol--serine O-phosphatidyltransferase, partial [Paramuribaculum sp.]|nr:CDP-diacylglycerol--serine O-phosphatidyltransferase [Paramuribaculum sp.]
IAARGALRLARFNVDDRQTTEFIGLPIPDNALFWIGYIAWMNSHAYPGLWVSLIFIVALGLMMVSPLHMFSLKFKNFAFKENYLRYLLIASAVLMVIWLGVPGFAWTIVIYILMSVVNR